MWKDWRGRLCIMLALSLACVMGMHRRFASPLWQVGIDQKSLEMKVEESVQLTVTGRTRDGETVSDQVCRELGLQWSIHSGEEILSVDENGLLTATGTGMGNVTVRCGNGREIMGDIITVFVKE